MHFLIQLASPDHFDAWDAIDEADRSRYLADYDAFADAVRARGTLVFGDALQRPETARTLRPGLDRTVVDGPYAESVEQLGGFYVVDLPDLASALEVAALLPREYTVEVRPTLGIVV